MARTATAPGVPTTRLGKAALEVDDRLIVAGPLRRTLNKVFPDHWSFLLGEIALYSFVVLLLSGTFLTFFFDASMREVVYDGSYAPLRGVQVSAAYDSTLDLSFDVRGGLFPAPAAPLVRAAVPRVHHGSPPAQLLHRRIPEAAGGE